MNREFDQSLIRIHIINIVVGTVLMLLMPWGGFVLWFFGGFFLLLIQLPVFAGLTIWQLVASFKAIRSRADINWKVQLSPYVLLILCVLLVHFAEKNHLNDPFYHDAFKIEATFNIDRSCEVSIDSQRLDGSYTYKFDAKSQEIYCSSRDLKSSSSLSVQINGPLRVNTYSMVSGSLFDHEFGLNHSPTVTGSVYLQLESGKLTITDVQFDSASDGKESAFSGYFMGIGKRHYR